VETFASPFGYWSKRVRSVVAEAGFRMAVQVGELPCRQEDDMLSSPRLSENRGTTPTGLAQLLEVRSTGVSRGVSAAKRRIWRALWRYATPIISTDPVEGAQALAKSDQGAINRGGHI
jgi:hypothetical protein